MISIEIDTKALGKRLDALAKKQVPFALAKALTVTAAQAKKAVDVQIPKKLDRPTPFTRRAIGIKRATKRKLQSEVFVKDVQAEYLKYAIEGGERRPSGKALVTPGSGMKLNKFGNMPRKKVKTLLANKKKYFVGKPKGMANAPAGIWERMGRGGRKNIRLAVQFKKQITYKKRLPFYKIVRGVVKNNFDKNFKKSFADAMRTAR